jgi:hypothetical protein
VAFNHTTQARGWVTGFVLFALLSSSFDLVHAQMPSMASQARSSTGLQAPGSTPVPQLVGHVSGMTESLAVAGDYAALVYWRGFELLDVSHPDSPRQVAFLPLSHHPTDVVLDHDYAYIPYAESGSDVDVSGNSHGLLTVDLADPTAPRVVSDFATAQSVDAFAEQDGIALSVGYTPGTDSPSLYVFDVTNPKAPQEVSKVENFCSARNIKIYTRPGPQGDRLAFVTCNHEVTVVDITNPNQPAVRGGYSNQGYLRDAALYLDDSIGEETPFLFLAVGHYDDFELGSAGLVALDLSDPDNLKEAAFLDAGKDYYQAVTYGRMLYAATDQGIAMFDISNPASPQPSGVYSATQSVWSLAQAGHYLYVADAQAGLQILDLADPVNPIQVGSRYSLAASGKASLVGRMAYVPSVNGLEIWDLFNPVEPRRVGAFDISTGSSLAAVSGDYALVSNGYTQTWLLDISNPITPVETSHLDFGASSMAVTGTVGAADTPKFAYLGRAVCDSIPELGCDSSLEVVDLSQTVTPTIMQKLSFQGVPKAIVLSGHLAFVAAWSDGLASSSFLAVYDTSEGTLSPLTTSVPIANVAEDLVLCGQFACVATWNGLSVLDLSDLAAIHEIGRFTYSPPSNAPSGISSLAIDGSFAYLTDAYNGLLVVVDLSDPARPRELARLQMPGSGGGVTFSDGYLYASNAMGGFSIYQTAAAAGQVRDVNGRPYSGVTIQDDFQALGASGLSGAFTLDAQPGQALTLKPKMPEYAFWPPERAVTASTTLRGQDFTILASPVSASLEPGITTTLRYTDTAGLLTEFSLPAGAAIWADRVIVTPTVASPPAGLAFAGHAFELAFQPAGSQPQDAVLDTPIAVAIAYSRANLRLVSDEQQLTLSWWDGQGWVDAAATCQPAAQDLQNHMLQASLCRAGRYALLGPTQRQFMPVMIRQP